MHADDALLGDGRDVCELRLHVSQNRMRDAAVPVGDDDQRRSYRQRDQRELPVVDEEDRRDDDDRDDVLREEDEPVAEEEAHGLEVDRRSGHELSRLASVVEAERQPQEVRVELVAHVVLDGERLSTREEAPPEHERAAYEPERDDCADPQRERRRVRSAESSSMTSPERTGTRMPATCERIARIDETMRETR